MKDLSVRGLLDSMATAQQPAQPAYTIKQRPILSPDEIAEAQMLYKPTSQGGTNTKEGQLQIDRVKTWGMK